MMSPNSQILFEGSYLYYDGEVNYSQENFKLERPEDVPQYHLIAEVLSRVESGEFLKLLVRWEMTHNYVPVMVKVEKSLGDKYTQETFKFDSHAQEMHYIFQSSNETHECKRIFGPKHYLAVPAFSTSTFFTLTKKFDATGRTPVTLISSNNNWTYESDPVEKLIFAEFKARDMKFNMNKLQLEAGHLCLYEHDSTFNGSEQAVDIYISKHHAIPYQLQDGQRKIVVKGLRKNS